MICSKCEKELPLDEFKMTTNRGKPYRMKQCKTCLAEYKRQHYLKNRGKYIASAKASHERNREKNLQYFRDRWQEDLEENRRKARERAKTERGRELNRLRSRRYRSNPEGDFKDKVRSEVYRALKTGEITRPDNCTVCDKECKPEAHHEDYDKPLEVVWVCKHCHEEIHHSNEGQGA